MSSIVQGFLRRVAVYGLSYWLFLHLCAISTPTVDLWRAG